MKTHDLVSLLAADATPVVGRAAPRRFAATLAIGGFVTLLAMFVLMGARPGIGQASLLPMFWFKLIFPAALAFAGIAALTRLGHPGMSMGRVGVAMALPLAVVWLMALSAMLEAAPGNRSALIWGATWRECPFYIAALSIPALLAALVAMKQLAPTRLRLAGAAAGLVAGAAAALAYALHCEEMEAPFIAIWYVAGILMPAAAGALLGPRLLRW